MLRILAALTVLLYVVYCTGSDVTDLKSVIASVEKLNGRVTALEHENAVLRRNLNALTHGNKRQRRQIPYPEEVGFTAKISQHLTNLGAAHTIVFDKPITNIGGGYDAMMGVFIAPVPGTYQFYSNVMSESGDYIETEIVKNGTQLVEMYSGGSATFDSTSNYVVTSLKKGDHVWVRVHGTWSINFAIHCCFSTFSGYLLNVHEEDTGAIVG